MTVEAPVVLFSSDGRKWRKPDRPLRWSIPEGPQITKIVVGTLANSGDEAESISLAKPCPDDWAERFPQLTHLHLWNIDNLTTLPPLPKGLRTLDVRGCARLRTLPALPDGLESLILTDCPSAVLPTDQDGTFPALTELMLSRSTSISSNWINRVLVGSPRIRLLDLSGCEQVTALRTYPRELVDLRLEDCEALTSLHSPWPTGLRRLSLRGATRLPGVPRDWPATLDYVDLAHAEALTSLPKPKRWPRTLFLFGGGVREIPASEHGATADENVARRTEKFFADLELTGAGDVKRCKLLILGNGGAGKTCLSAALLPHGDVLAAQEMGTTHGVQFWDWNCPAAVQNGVTEDVQLTLWDFGGQEIYHNTHRLFMSSGAVFLVVWNPDQDDKTPPLSASEYQDEWRPLQYWLDLIRQSCLNSPRIAIVCSHHKEMLPSLEKRLRARLRREDFDSIPRYYVDSTAADRNDDGRDLPKLRQWLESNVGEVVSTQGTQVPAYWEIAQDLVADWVRRMKDDSAFAARHNYLTPEQFRKHLNSAIAKRTANDAEGRFAKLTASLRTKRGKGFQLDDDRLQRTLEFLTHSGWAYWDPQLFQGQVIIGQKWALDGLYAVLDRRPETRVFKSLMRSGGRFTVEELDEWQWRDSGYGADEQKLLLSFMERCGLCFQLRSAHDAWREQDVYVSFEHLPKRGREAWTRQFESRRTQAKSRKWSRDVPGLHKYHWQRFLYAAGAHYGKDAQYALDGFYLENREREKLLVLCELNSTGLGGRIEVRVGGEKADERLKSAVEYVQRFLPDREATRTESPASSMGEREEKREVFVSYAWDPPKDGRAGRIPPGYEEPVNAIEQLLKDQPVITLVRDKISMERGDSIASFISHGAKCPHVIVVHSDKSWQSPYCCYELLKVRDELAERKDRDFRSVVIAVEHPTSRIRSRKAVDTYLDYWKDYDERDLPVSVEGDPKHFVTASAPGVVEWFHRKLGDHKDVNLLWPDGDKTDRAVAKKREAVLAEIARCLRLENS